MKIKVNELKEFKHFADDYYYDEYYDVLLMGDVELESRSLLWDGKIQEAAREYLKQLAGGKNDN